MTRKLNASLHCINLRPGTNNLAEIVLQGEEGTSPPTLTLPAFPASTLTWLGDLGHAADQRHGICLAVLLLLDLNHQSWGIYPPRQRPDRDGVSWCLDIPTQPPASESSGRPGGMLIAGSFQTTRLRLPDEMVSFVPPVDGLHLVGSLTADLGGAMAFLRMEGKLVQSSPSDLIYDDWNHRIEAVLNQLPLDGGDTAHSD